ncbi:MAG: response regulator transcription factor [Phycisphaerales bacterium]
MDVVKHILVVEDEKDLAELLSINLRRFGYDVTLATTGRAALDALAHQVPDLVLLDVMLPELSGTEVASRIRSNPAMSDTPIIMVTAKGTETDQLVGLTAGADDYIVKPFSMRILQARIEAVLRRTQRPAANAQTLTLGSVEIDIATHEVTVDGQPIKLTLTEFKLLCTLLQSPNRVLNRSVLMSRAMGPGVTVTERTIDVHITAIRKKLGDKAYMIRTIRGVGYRATADVDQSEDVEQSATN